MSGPSRFLTALDTTQVSSPTSSHDTQLVLDRDLVFWDADTRTYWIAPAGTVTDLASTPIALFGATLVTARAAVAHDAAYRRTLRCTAPDTHWAFRAGLLDPQRADHLTRRQADALLYRALLACGFGRPRAYGWWLGVRALALPAWRRGRA